MALYQDIIGQLPILKTYNHVTLGFELIDENCQRKIVGALEGATDKLTSSFPWLAGAVINEGSGPGNSGLFKPVPWPDNALSPNNILRVQNCVDIVPSYAELLSAGAPISMLDGKILTPYPGFPVSYKDSEGHPAPIIVIQANFVKGGLLLNFSAQHNVIDAGGLLQIIQLVATALRGESYSHDAIKQGNRDRAKIIKLIAPGEPVRDHSHLKRPPGLYVARPMATSSSSSTVPKPRWAYFRMHGSAVPRIKALATLPEGYDASVPFISTNDALSAFYWKCIASVRMRNGRAPNAVSKFGRAIDTRKAMGIPVEYMGHMVYHAATRMQLRELEEAPLATVACRLRKDLNDVNNEHSVRSYATYIANEPDKSQILYGGLFNPDTDVGASAVSHTGFFVSFGPLGVPAFVRRPDLAPIPGCVYFMPPENNSLIVLVCLTEVDLEGLRTYPDWSQCTELVG